MNPIAIVLIVVALIGVGVLVSAVKIVRPYQRGLVERLGKYKTTRNPGLNLILPFIETMQLIDMREQVVDVPPQEVITADNVVVSVDAVEADEPVGAHARFEFVVADDSLGVPVQADPDHPTAAQEDEPLDLDGDVVEAEQRGAERGDGEGQQHERSGEHREFDQGEEHGNAEPYPWPEIQVDPEIQHASNLSDTRSGCVPDGPSRPSCHANGGWGSGQSFSVARRMRRG